MDLIGFSIGFSLVFYMSTPRKIILTCRGVGIGIILNDTRQYLEKESYFADV